MISPDLSCTSQTIFILHDLYMLYIQILHDMVYSI